MGEKVPTSRQDARREVIEEAAYRVLMRDGYKAASILAIAKEAKASNETLYRWYGNKQGLFKALVEGNASTARALLQEALQSHSDPLQALEKLGPVLLALVTSERAIAINRAAAGDFYDTKTLGEALSQGGRGAVVPLIAKLLEEASKGDQLSVSDPGEAADSYIDLLIGDWQIRRVTGAMEVPSGADIENRAAQALRRFLALCGASAT
ncbi:MAG: TetR/AcrR family transcriptional regulator [Cohaesibacteraceae bacterium]